MYIFLCRRDAIVSLFCTCETFWRTETLGGSEIVRYYSTSSTLLLLVQLMVVTDVLCRHMWPLCSVTLQSCTSHDKTFCHSTASTCTNLATMTQHKSLCNHSYVCYHCQYLRHTVGLLVDLCACGRHYCKWTIFCEPFCDIVCIIYVDSLWQTSSRWR